MKVRNSLIGAAATIALLGTAACTTNPETGQRTVSAMDAETRPDARYQKFRAMGNVGIEEP